jgi:hypothetical protein
VRPRRGEDSRGARRAERRRPFRAPAPTLLVFCEGKVTERQYINDLARHLRATSVSVSREHGDPKHLVEFAVAERRARRRGREARDSIWCVFDADDHERLTEALVQARDNNLPVALSNPCFELWVLLHFEDQTAFIERAPLRARVQEFIPGYDKLLPFDVLLPGEDDAMARAEALSQRHVGNGSPEHENPSSGVWRLVADIASVRTAP